jgi:dolichol-phosphate mannosyltransferase
MAWRAIKANLRVAEVPITFVERELGESKMDSSIVKEALWRVTQWGIEKRFSDLKWLLRLS